MQNKRMLIDGLHQEETRVVILENNNIVEYDFEVTNKEELKGNIYLAKVTRVEPSLQAVFVDYGVTKQGFLPFNEIHINYFNISQNDIAEIKRKERDYKELIKQKRKEREENKDNNVIVNSEEKSYETNIINNLAKDPLEKTENEEDFTPTTSNKYSKYIDSKIAKNTSIDDTIDIDEYETSYNNEQFNYGLRYGYQVQDVIKKDQYILVQVVKEERGNKGAALTTYLSLPGRYCVFMPNTPFDGGISRKINNIADRQHLKDIISSLEIDEDTNIIIRTAGASRSKTEITQDYSYIKVLWENIQHQEQTSKEPRLIYEEGNLVKKVIRDLFSGSIEEIIIDGKETFEVARNFAKLIAPDMMKKINRFHNNSNKISLFQQYKVEEEIRSMYSPVVFLKSGGYLVIHPTEALVTIDINSGKFKGKRNIEETALKTNTEAAIEIARQIKLRDVGGLIVIDFIDMENPKNRAIIEKKLKEAVRDDKARVQIGQISTFGLLELSRQRLKSSLVERSFTVCNKCQGIGYVRPLELNALQILRNLYLDAEKAKYPVGTNILIKMPTAESFYLLNQKRYYLNALENIFNATIRIDCDDSLMFPFYFIEELHEKKQKDGNTTVLLLEQEIEANINNKYKDTNNRYRANGSIALNGKSKLKNKNSRNNTYNKNKKPIEDKKPVVKSWFKKILGM